MAVAVPHVVFTLEQTDRTPCTGDGAVDLTGGRFLHAHLQGPPGPAAPRQELAPGL